jgi:hypothetical protein
MDFWQSCVDWWRSYGIPLNAPILLLCTILSVVASCSSLYTARYASQQADESSVRQSLITYIAVEAEDRDKIPYDAITTVNGYETTDPKNRNRIQILLGLLVNTVDTMYKAEDPRVDTWAGFICAIPGPLGDKAFKIEGYAADSHTLTAIAKAKAFVRDHPKGCT